MRVDADSGGDGEVAGGGLAGKILVFDAAERNAADMSVPAALARDGSARRGAGAERDAEIVRQRVSSAEGKNGESDGRARQSLDDIVDGAIAAAGEYGVAARRHGKASVVGGF